MRWPLSDYGGELYLEKMRGSITIPQTRKVSESRQNSQCLNNGISSYHKMEGELRGTST